MNGKPIYYYNGKQLTNERFFRFKGEGRVEGFLPNGERVVVPSSEVTTERPSVAEHTKQELPTEIKAEFGSATKEEESPEVEESLSEEMTEKPGLDFKNGSTIRTVVASDNTRGARSHVLVAAEEESEEVSEFEGQALLVEDSNGDVSKLTYGSDDFNKVVNDNKLDLEAIDRMLNNEQKTHKGFSFTLA